MNKHVFLITILLLIFCAPAAQSKDLVLATTTSTKSSGLLDKLIPAFEKDTDLKVKIHTVGTGKALRMGRQGEVDVLLVHAPKAEIKFVTDGYGVMRVPVMKNDFIIAGPRADLAQVNAMHDIKQAFENIKNSSSLFVSRADDSGTHKKEMSIWEACEVEPYGDWYYELGAGMAATLHTANSKLAYVMVDRGTWLASRNDVELVLHVEGDPLLANPYHVIAVNPKRHEKANYPGAKRFIAWITGKQGQHIINQLKIDNEQLFTVTAK